MLLWLSRLIIGWPTGIACKHFWTVKEKVKRFSSVSEDKVYYVMQCEHCGDVKKKRIN